MVQFGSVRFDSLVLCRDILLLNSSDVERDRREA